VLSFEGERRGDNDANDSVIFRDSDDEEDEKLIGELFGKEMQKDVTAFFMQYIQAGPMSVR
jgi:hypothetical protein